MILFKTKSFIYMVKITLIKIKSELKFVFLYLKKKMSDNSNSIIYYPNHSNLSVNYIV
jgi:hypothetical protein